MKEIDKEIEEAASILLRAGTTPKQVASELLLPMSEVIRILEASLNFEGTPLINPKRYSKPRESLFMKKLSALLFEQGDAEVLEYLGLFHWELKNWVTTEDLIKYYE